MVREITGFRDRVWLKDGGSCEMEFDTSGPLNAFHESKLPPEIECVEIIEILFN